MFCILKSFLAAGLFRHRKLTAGTGAHQAGDGGLKKPLQEKDPKGPPGVLGSNRRRPFQPAASSASLIQLCLHGAQDLILPRQGTQDGFTGSHCPSRRRSIGWGIAPRLRRTGSAAREAGNRPAISALFHNGRPFFSLDQSGRGACRAACAPLFFFHSEEQRSGVGQKRRAKKPPSFA